MAAAALSVDDFKYIVKLEMSSSEAYMTISGQPLHVDLPKYTKITQLTGETHMAGYIGGSKGLPVPVAITYFQAEAGAHTVRFVTWQPSGVFVDHDLADAYIKKTFPKATWYRGVNGLINAVWSVSQELEDRLKKEATAAK